MRSGHTLEIVATLGPGSWDLAVAMWGAGADSFRLNASHLAAEALRIRAAAIRAQLPDAPLVIDLQGAKMRLGSFAERPVHAGEHIRFSLRGGEGTVPLPHKELFGSVAPGETLSCDDDRVRFRVERVGAGEIETSALTGWSLRPRKGVNLLEHPVTLDDISDVDLACIRSCRDLGRVAFAFSFMKDGLEAEWLRGRAPQCAVIGKIERREALVNLPAIAQSSDDVWICRGDLGAQLGPAGLARFLSGYDPRIAPCRVLLAGQVVEHLTSHAEPTRSEVCHLFDLVNRGYSGFVLSDETAIGSDPVRAVATLRSLLAAFQ